MSKGIVLLLSVVLILFISSLRPTCYLASVDVARGVESSQLNRPTGRTQESSLLLLVSWTIEKEERNQRVFGGSQRLPGLVAIEVHAQGDDWIAAGYTDLALLLRTPGAT